MFLAIDDTDGPGGGCTTYVATRILTELGPQHAAGLPRLVRLQPDNRWKTRGNAALVLPLDPDCQADEVLAIAACIVRQHAHDNEGKGAGVAIFETPPTEAWYRWGVQQRVDLDAARRALAGVPTWTMGTGRGLVGCLCAAAWRPGPEATFTHLVYRQAERWGTSRAIDPAIARQIQQTEPHIFDAYDEANHSALVAPRTPCPVLLGLRATRPERLGELARQIAQEPVHAEQRFITNQASDDHLVPATLTPLTAQQRAQTLEGGHVRLQTRTARGRAREVLAFEPTGNLRKGLLDVEAGDRLLALGSLKRAGRQVNAEKILHVQAERSTPADCPGCGGRMASAGQNAGYRCRRCGTRHPGRRRPAKATWHEADASARRHLARPLALGLADAVAQAADRLVAQAPVQVEPSAKGLAEH